MNTVIIVKTRTDSHKSHGASDNVETIV